MAIGACRCDRFVADEGWESFFHRVTGSACELRVFARERKRRHCGMVEDGFLPFIGCMASSAGSRPGRVSKLSLMRVAVACSTTAIGYFVHCSLRSAKLPGLVTLEAGNRAVLAEQRKCRGIVVELQLVPALREVACITARGTDLVRELSRVGISVA